MSGAERILIVDDDADIRRALRQALVQAGYDVLECEDGAAALELLGHEAVSVMVLDVEMPRLNGWKTLAALRKRNWHQPVLMVTHVADVDSRVYGLETGADDYIAKPYVAAELLARVRALLRRAGRPRVAAARLQFGALEVDLARKTATAGDAPVHLTGTEYRLLQVLAADAGSPVSREHLFAAVWGAKAGTSHTLDTHIWRLRKKLRDTGEHPRWILNHPGLGFSLSPEAIADGAGTRT